MSLVVYGRNCPEFNEYNSTVLLVNTAPPSSLPFIHLRKPASTLIRRRAFTTFPLCLHSHPFPQNYQPHFSIFLSLSNLLPLPIRNPRTALPALLTITPKALTKPSLSLTHNRETPSSHPLTRKCLTSLPSSPTSEP